MFYSVCVCFRDSGVQWSGPVEQSFDFCFIYLLCFSQLCLTVSSLSSSASQQCLSDGLLCGFSIAPHACAPVITHESISQNAALWWDMKRWCKQVCSRVCSGAECECGESGHIAGLSSVCGWHELRWELETLPDQSLTPAGRRPYSALQPGTRPTLCVSASHSEHGYYSQLQLNMVAFYNKVPLVNCS